MCPEEPGDFEKFLRYCGYAEFDPAPSRSGVYKPVNSREGFSKALSLITPEDIPMVMATCVDKLGWFTEGATATPYTGATGSVPSSIALSPTSRAHRLLEWVMAGKP